MEPRACPVTRKISFTTKAKAVKGLRRPRAAEGQAREVYRCPLCGHWHHTSQRRRLPASLMSATAGGTK
jgi:hypothetical protein